MSILNRLRQWIADPPPELAFEISEAGLAYARPASAEPPSIRRFDSKTLSISPHADNIVNPQEFEAAVRDAAGGFSGRRRRTAALILPDFCARVAILPFDTFPSELKEQVPLVRFRLRKSVPFELESAVTGWQTQPLKGSGVEVVVAAAALEVIARYEAPFRAAGLHPGLITTSAIAATELFAGSDSQIFAKLDGRYLTVSIIHAGALKLVRNAELTDGSAEEIIGILFPTVAFVEDELGTRPTKILLCGFGTEYDTGRWAEELQVSVEILTSRWGTPTAHNSGLIGYLHGVNAPGAAQVA